MHRFGKQILATSLLTCSLASTAQAQIQPRIVGGTPTGQGYEWMAYLLIKIPNEDRYVSTCGATLIAKDWLLTAAHCVEHNDGTYAKPSDILARVGIYSTTDHAPNQNHRAKRVVVHPDWSGEQSRHTLNDIALIQLQEPLTNDTVRLVTPEEYQALESTAAQSSNGFSTLPLTAMGWGKLDTNKNSPKELHETDLYLMNDQQCTLESNGNNVRGNYICVDHPYQQKSICQGDSGGPLLLNTSGPVQVGVTSFSVSERILGQNRQVYTCATSPYSGFAHVAKLRSFIEAHIPELAEQPAQPETPQPNATQPDSTKPNTTQPDTTMLGNESNTDANAAGNPDEEPKQSAAGALNSLMLLAAFFPALRRRRLA